MRDAASLKIGTRGSQLALAQTHLFIHRFRELYPEWPVEIVRISTKGDRVQDRPLAQIGGKALFVEEIEQALRVGNVHVAVHSAKDIPSSMSQDMEIAAFLPRADVRDVFVSNVAPDMFKLDAGARVGTSSPRRACQIRALRSDLNIADIRGNVDTRLAKLDRGEYDGIVLAAAGLQRLGLSARVTQYISTEHMLPCAGQGAIALETMLASPFANMLRAVNDSETMAAVSAERAFAERVSGTCESPVAALAVLQGNALSLSAMLGNLDGRFVSATLSGVPENAVHIGHALADRLLQAGGSELIARPAASEFR